MVFTEEERKERKSERDRKYRENNKEKILENKRKYSENNKEKRREYRENNKDKIKEYNQTDAGKKAKRISGWKCRGGVECDDFNVLYEYFINCKNCEECDIELTEDKVRTNTTRCLDHEHTTGLFRNVLCHSCNTKRG